MQQVSVTRDPKTGEVRILNPVMNEPGKNGRALPNHAKTAHELAVGLAHMMEAHAAVTRTVGTLRNTAEDYQDQRDAALKQLHRVADHWSSMFLPRGVKSAMRAMGVAI
jgi:hypothetical protein